MNLTWLYTLGSVFVVSIVSLIGILFITLKKQSLEKILMFLVSFSAGALMGGAFIHLLPEAVRESGFSVQISAFVIFGILTFFVLEKIIFWRHCHIVTSAEHPHPFAYMNLIGDAFHNFIDGMVIAGSFLVSAPLGLATTMAVFLHEVPQEIGEFGVLVHGGFSRPRALLLNFASALTAFLGAILILVLNIEIKTITGILIPFTAGGFIYIAGSDLIPELKKDITPLNSLFQLLALLLGVGLMLVV